VETKSATVLGAFTRDLRAEDLLECLSINPGRIGDELVGRARAIEIWKSLISSRSFTSAVIQTDSSIAGRRIVGFGASVFVRQRFADEEFSRPRPGLNARVFAGIDSGKSVVLSEPELRAANTTGGLDSLILYGSWRYEVLSPEGVHEVCSCLGFSYVENHRGYRLNRLIGETVGHEERIALEASRVWRAVRHLDEPGRQPWSLWVITKEDSLAVKANIINPLFIHKEPVLGLRDADQQLLLAAINGLTDDELSLKLGLTLNAVKKRWVSIFHRTIDAQPALFPAISLNDGQKRGRQKRHHVLAYVRAHMEELRPTLQRTDTKETLNTSR
jgi:hypothetical protein